jgi:hypothetical protein
MKIRLKDLQETEVADAHEASSKGVEEKALQELLHGQGHQAEPQRQERQRNHGVAKVKRRPP